MSSKGKKRKRTESREAEEEASGSGGPSTSAPQTLGSTDFTCICPVCFEVFQEPYVTTCGHSFCYQCIMKTIAKSPQCPVCKGNLPLQNPIHPNFSLNHVVVKYRQTANAEKAQAAGSPRVDDILSMADKMTGKDVKHLLLKLQHKVDAFEENEKLCEQYGLLEFLHTAKRQKLMERENLERELSVLDHDIARVTSQLTPDDQTAPSVSPLQPQDSDSFPSSSEDTAMPSQGGGGVVKEEQEEQVVPAAISELLGPRNLRMHSNVDELMDNYFALRVQPFRWDSDSDSEGGGLREFSTGLHNFTRYSSFRELSALAYGDQITTCAIVSSIEFDKDGEYIAVAGVTKKIKVFDYSNVMKNIGFTNHYPVQEMVCSAKLSSVCYNPYHKSTLASADYDGCVGVWDTATGRRVTSHVEHNKRVWSVVFNPCEPNLYASGSDDCTVKLWCNNQPQSIFSVPTKANVCAVRFSPSNRYHIVYGSADHTVHILDLRNPQEALCQFRGHRKAVSYVQFISNDEIVSASTDNELKLWSTTSGQCLRTYRGHTNEKNFIGLTVNPNFIACGSEDNSFYVYSKYVARPMLQYRFNFPRNILPDPSAAGDRQPEMTDFVSSVCWKKDSNVIVAANSQGLIKVLEMC